MLRRMFCNCHRLLQVAYEYMRHCWNKIFFVVIRVLVVINQMVIMSPFIYSYLENSKGNSITIGPTTASQFARSDCCFKLAVKWKFRTQRWLTVVAIFLFTFYVVIAPFIVIMASNVNAQMRSSDDTLFRNIAMLTTAVDLLCFLLIMANNIWHREDVVELLNLFNEIYCTFEQLEKNLIGLKTFLVVAAKTIFMMSIIILNMFYLFVSASHIATENMVAFVLSHYFYTLDKIFDLAMLTFMLLFLACSLQLEKELKCCQVSSNDLEMSHLIRLQNALQKLLDLFRNIFQLGIFSIILSHFITILCNLYALLDYLVSAHVFPDSFATYSLSATAELYSLIYAAYLCGRSQRKVKDLFLQREELYFLQSPSSSIAIVEMDVLWPQLNNFQLLGLFTFDNKFALYLLNYSINFIVIILQFAVNKIREIQG